MISIQKSFLFIHVPKTGGNSIQSVLRDYSEDDIVTVAEHQDAIERFAVHSKTYGTSKHSPLSHYKSAVETKTYDSLFKFATIRNPWEMMVSYYFSPHRGVARWNRRDFADLVSKVQPLRSYICEPTQNENGVTSIASGQTTGNPRLTGDIDYLMRFEHLSDDFSVVCGLLGIPPTPLPRRNSSTHQHYSCYYDKELQEMVADRFAEEIDFAGYRFDCE